jgi:hypothetical protein
MAKFKIGDKVKDIETGRIGIVDEIGDLYTTITSSDGKYIYNHNRICLEDGWQQGDVLVNKDDEQRMILGICGEVYFTTCPDSELASDGIWTKKELIKEGYKPLSETPVLEVTLEQVAEKFGVDKIKIK